MREEQKHFCAEKMGNSEGTRSRVPSSLKIKKRENPAKARHPRRFFFIFFISQQAQLHLAQKQYRHCSACA